MPDFDAKAFLNTLTSRPGVYQMYDDQGELLYVGKAKNLKNRVTSYFRASGLTAKTMALVARIGDIQVTVTSTEVDAHEAQWRAGVNRQARPDAPSQRRAASLSAAAKRRRIRT